MARHPLLLPLLGLAYGLAAGPSTAAEGDLFEIIPLEGDGRTVAAELADLDGDGRTDVLRVVILGIPPREERRLRVHLQGADGVLPTTPSFERPLPGDCAGYDLADLLESPGVELVLWRPAGLSLLSLAGPDAPGRELAVPRGAAVAAEDERGLERVPLVWHGLGPEPWLLVPRLGDVVAVTADGRERAVLETGARVNYFVPARPGPVVAESDVQLFIDLPRVIAGDVDGDGRADLVTATRQALRVFLRRADGSYPRTPDRTLDLERISEEDHLRGTGQVRVAAADFDGDGRLDLLVSEASGGLLDARSHTTVHRNRAGGWDLGRPDRSFRRDDAWSADDLLDLDGDGRPELVRIWIPMNVLELVEALVTRSLDVHVSVHRADAETGFAAEPWLERKLGISVDLRSGRPPGFVPTARSDLNADGRLDLIDSGDGDEILVFLGDGERPFREVAGRQPLDSGGRLRLGDIDGDGLQDLLLYDPRDREAPVRIGRNRGRLPGTPRSLRLEPRP